MTGSEKTGSEKTDSTGSAGEKDFSGRFAEVLSVVDPISTRFRSAGFELYLVGGVVRDLMLGSHGALDDIDMTTEARPEEIKRLLDGVATSLWTQGERFGTIGARVCGRDIEITTHRAESYESDSRKPQVEFGDDLRVDLSRRDFSLNAMAYSTVSGQLFDPFDGLVDLEQRLLRTPDDPEISFVDDPLRMLRAARFIPRFSLKVDPALTQAAHKLADRLRIVSAERIHDEWEKLLAAPDPSLGFAFLSETGLLDHIITSVPSASAGAISGNLAAVAGSPNQQAQYAAASLPGSQPVRRAAMAWHLSREQLSGWLKQLRYSSVDQAGTKSLFDGAHHVLETEPSPAALRQLVKLVGLADVEEVFVLVSNLSKTGVFDTAEGVPALLSPTQHLSGFMNHLSSLSSTEDLSNLSSPLGGGELIAGLGLTPGPLVGQLVSRLSNYRVEHGPFTAQQAMDLARKWSSGDEMVVDHTR